MARNNELKKTHMFIYSIIYSTISIIIFLALRYKINNIRGIIMLIILEIIPVCLLFKFIRVGLGKKILDKDTDRAYHFTGSLGVVILLIILIKNIFKF